MQPILIVTKDLCRILPEIICAEKQSRLCVLK